MASSWDLAVGRCAGFSGTDDTKDLLPLYLKQDTSIASLRTTNGRMIDLLTNPDRRNTRYESLPASAQVADILPTMCEKSEFHVLIDAGALMEGMTNREVVLQVLALVPRFQFGIYFNNDNRIVRIVRNSDREEPLGNFTITTETFTYLDDIHTRGTDLQFPDGSIANVTVCAGIMKDKLMQVRILQPFFLCCAEEDLCYFLPKNAEGSATIGVHAHERTQVRLPLRLLLGAAGGHTQNPRESRRFYQVDSVA